MTTLGEDGVAPGLATAATVGVDASNGELVDIETTW